MLYLFINLFNPPSNPAKQDCVSFHFTDEDTEGPSAEAFCLSSQGWIRSPSTGFAHLSVHWHPLQGLLKHRSLGPTPRSCELEAWVASMHFPSSHIPRHSWVLLVGATFENPCSKLYRCFSHPLLAGHLGNAEWE